MHLAQFADRMCVCVLAFHFASLSLYTYLIVPQNYSNIINILWVQKREEINSYSGRGHRKSRNSASAINLCFHQHAQNPAIHTDRHLYMLYGCMIYAMADFEYSFRIGSDSQNQANQPIWQIEWWNDTQFQSKLNKKKLLFPFAERVECVCVKERQRELKVCCVMRMLHADWQ